MNSVWTHGVGASADAGEAPRSVQLNPVTVGGSNEDERMWVAGDDSNPVRRMAFGTETAAEAFAADLPADQAAVLAATQRPIAFSAGSDPSGVPAWQTIPSWSLIGTADHVIPPAEQLFMSKRASAHITEIDAGHLSLISHPGAVTHVITAAAQATG